MARKRLNKKVALIGSLFLAIVALAVIWLFLNWTKDPEPFIKDGNAELKIAEEATDEQTKAEHYAKAAQNYHRARSRAKSDSLKVELLFKLVDIYIKTDEWKNVLGCWDAIVQIEPENIKARLGRIQYSYILADSVADSTDSAARRRFWQDVESQASEFIQVVDQKLLVDDINKWKTAGFEGIQTQVQNLGTYLKLLRGRALLEMTKLGAVTNQDESLANAIEDLNDVRKVEPNNVDVYWYLKQAVTERGEILASRGNLEEKQKAQQQAEELLQQAIEVAPNDPKPLINLMSMKLEDAEIAGIEQIQSLEPEFLSLVKEFPSSAQAYSKLAEFYVRLGHQNFDKATEAIEKAIELDSQNVNYAIAAANLHYHKLSINQQEKELYKAIETAKNALDLPGAQDKPGPRRWANRINRITLYFFLAYCHIEQVLDPSEERTQSQSLDWLQNAEKMVHEIEQFYGSGENIQVVKWQGLLELAKAKLGQGDENIAIRKLYATYEHLKASGRNDARTSYILAQVFKNTSELGATKQFLESSLDRDARIDLVKPEVLLDYADILLKLRIYNTASHFIDSFESRYWTNQRSRQLRIKAYIGTRQFEKAEEELAKAEPDDPNIIQLNMRLLNVRIRQIRRNLALRRIEDSLAAEKEDVESQGIGESITDEIKNYQHVLAELLAKQLSIEPNSADATYIAAVCTNYIREGKIEQAKAIVDKCLRYLPNNTTALFYKQLLAEPELLKISQEKYDEIKEKVLSNIPDPSRRAMHLGTFYQDIGDPNKAAVEFKKVLASYLGDSNELTSEITQPSQKTTTENKKIKDRRNSATTRLFDIALKKEDWDLAEKIAQIARNKNLDACEGNYFTARIDVAKRHYEDALIKLDECLKQRPVFSYAYSARSRVNSALRNEHQAIEDARRAASLNPLSEEIAKLLALTLYRRNQKLGDNVTSAQTIEARDALRRAINLNPREWRLQSLYAEYISDTNPHEALAIRQRLQKVFPTLGNALLLAQMAMKMSSEEKNPRYEQALLNIAESSLEQARAIEPQSKNVLDGYTEYYRLTEQSEKAEQLLDKSQDKVRLGRYYFKAGRFEDARNTLEQLYQNDPKNSDIIKNLLAVAEKIGDREAVEKYSEELISLEDSAENRIIQIQKFLSVGLIKETENKLQSFKEKYPHEARIPLIEALLTMRKGQLDKALELVEQSLAVEQENPGAWRLKGEINRYKANYSQAVSDLKSSIALVDDLDTRFSLAKTYLQAGRVNEAITELKSMMDDPQFAMKSRELLEQTYLRNNRTQALVTLYSETINKFPENLSWYSKAAEYALQTKDFGAAEELYKQSWRKSRDKEEPDARAFDGYLRTLMVQGKFGKVLEEAGKYIDSDLATIALYRIAATKIELKDINGAVQCYRMAADKAKTQAIASDVLQKMHAALGDEEVRKYCYEKIQNKEKLLTAYFTLYNLEKLKKNYNKAIEHLEKCIQIVKDNKQHKLSYIKIKAEILEAAYSKTSDNKYLQDAINQYESLLEEMPNNISVLNNLAYRLAENNERINEALEYAKKAYELQPNNPLILDTYAFVLYKTGEYEKAAELIQAALQHYEKDNIFAPVDIYEHLGMVKEKLGADNEAIAAYKQALEAGANKLSKPVEERINAAIERVSQ